MKRRLISQMTPPTRIRWIASSVNPAAIQKYQMANN